MCVNVHFDAEKIKLGLSKIAVHFDAGKPQLNATEIFDLLWGRQRPPKLKRPYIPPTQFTHAPRRMGRNPRRRNAARPATCGKDDSPGDDVPHAVYHGCTFNIVNSDPALAGELAAMKAELEQARQEKAALQAELEKIRHGQEPADLEKHGLCGRIIMWRSEGKTEEEIAAILSGRCCISRKDAFPKTPCRSMGNASWARPDIPRIPKRNQHGQHVSLSDVPGCGSGCFNQCRYP